MYGVTEELWFHRMGIQGHAVGQSGTLREMVAAPPRRNFRRRRLVTHGEVGLPRAIGEGFQLFTYLQNQNVPSKLLYFPDEGHWILKPQIPRLGTTRFSAVRPVLKKELSAREDHERNESDARASSAVSAVELQALPRKRRAERAVRGAEKRSGVEAGRSRVRSGSPHESVEVIQKAEQLSKFR